MPLFSSWFRFPPAPAVPSAGEHSISVDSGSGQAQSDPVTENGVNGGVMEQEKSPQSGDYQHLQEWLLKTTFVSSLVIGAGVTYTYSLEIAASYWLGALVGMVYLRMLARAVARLGNGNKRLGSGRFGLVAALLLVATQVKSLHVIPVFLGFLTFKVALVFYTIQTLIPLLTQSRSSSVGSSSSGSSSTTV